MSKITFLNLFGQDESPNCCKCGTNRQLTPIVEQTNKYSKMIIADNNISEFMNQTSEWMKKKNVVHIKINSYVPTANV